MKKMILNSVKKASLLLCFFATAITQAKAQTTGSASNPADPSITSIVAIPYLIELGQFAIVKVQLDNLSSDPDLVIVPNSLDAQISAGGNAEIIGIIPDSSDASWTQYSLTTGTQNTIHIRNTAGGIPSFSTQIVYLKVKGTAIAVPSQQPISSHISYFTGNNPALGGLPNFTQGNATTVDDNNTTSLIVVAPLPIHLLSFTGAAVPGKCTAQLQWATGEEKNFDHFNVQSGSDGETFVTAGDVKSKGNATGSTYNYTVDQPSGKTYYRLQMVDLDGTTSFSNILSVATQCDANTASVWSVYPNPAMAGTSQRLQYTATSNKHEIVKAVVTDIVGKQIWTAKLEAAPGQNIYSLPSETWQRGSYYVNLYDQNGNKIYITQKIVLD